MEAFKDLPNMFSVRFWIVRIDEDIVQIDDDMNINQVFKNIVNEPRPSGWRVGETERHNQPFKRPVASPECGLPFVSVGNADKMIGMPEVDFGVNPGFPGGIQKVSK